MNRFRFFKRNLPQTVHGERGHALLELALVMPLLLFIPLATSEYARVLRLKQTAGVISREAGSMAFRRCNDFRELGGRTATSQRTSECLEDVLQGPDSTGIQQFADTLAAPGTISVRISVFRYDEASGVPELWRVATAGRAPHSQIESRGAVLVERTTNAVLIGSEEVQQRERILVSEVTVQYNPLIAWIPGKGTQQAFEMSERTIF